jgi:hypothetical protein
LRLIEKKRKKFIEAFEKVAGKLAQTNGEGINNQQ